jgi:hypothetical protein
MLLTFSATRSLKKKLRVSAQKSMILARKGCRDFGIPLSANQSSIFSTLSRLPENFMGKFSRRGLSFVSNLEVHFRQEEVVWAIRTFRSGAPASPQLADARKFVDA